VLLCSDSHHVWAFGLCQKPPSILKIPVRNSFGTTQKSLNFKVQVPIPMGVLLLDSATKHLPESRCSQWEVTRGPVAIARPGQAAVSPLYCTYPEPFSYDIKLLTKHSHTCACFI
jgi:hypothetical protein